MKRLVDAYPSEIIDAILNHFRPASVIYTRDHKGRFSKERVMFYGQLRQRLGAK